MIDKPFTLTDPLDKDKVIKLERFLGEVSRNAAKTSDLPVAGTTVVTETTFGQTAAVGVSPKFSPVDHTHGTPPLSSAIAPVFDFTVTGAAVTTIDTGAILDGLTHGGYRFEIELQNPAGGGATWRAWFNGDTTAADYAYESISTNGSVVSTVAGADSILMGTGLLASTRTVFSGSLLFGTDGIIRMHGLGTGNASRDGYFRVQRVLAAPETNLTSFRIDSAPASRIDVGSRVRLWRLQ
jgi:hypothetical protein